MAAEGYDITRPINDWCSDGSEPDPGELCPDGDAARPGRGRELGRLGPVLHRDVRAARRPGLLHGRDVQQRDAVRRPRSAPARPSASWPSRRSSSSSPTATTCSSTCSRTTGAASTNAPRPECCPPPFDVDNNWMLEYPEAYVIPRGAGQRSDPEANRLVEWMLFNGIEVEETKQDVHRRRADVREGLLRRARWRRRAAAWPTPRCGSASTSPTASRSSTRRPRRGATATCGAPTS